MGNFSFKQLKQKALETIRDEPALTNLITTLVLKPSDFREALGALLTNQCLFLHEGMNLLPEIQKALAEDPSIAKNAAVDLEAIAAKDPAACDYLEPFLFYKGFHSLELYRIGHFLWNKGKNYLAYYVQSRVSLLYGVDIHPAAVIGKGVFIDHATAIVIGETAVIEDNVSLLHQVTLGGTGKETGKRHPTIRRDCLLGAGATILGDIEIGEGSVVGAGSVVLHPIPPHSVAVGVPAETKGTIKVRAPSNKMDQIFDSYGYGANI
jgi:serine O-acetyltransferase